MIEDITDKKTAEEALRASQERLRLAHQAAGIGTFERDVRTGRITWAEGLEPLYGLSPGSLDGKTPAFFKDLIHPADRERVAHLIQQALKTGQPTEGEWRAIWSDGSVHWIVSRWRVLTDDSGEPSRVVGVNMDVTARKLAEEALRESEEKFRSVFRDAGVGMVVVSPEGRFLAANSAFCDYLGFTEEDLLQKTVESVTFPEDWPAFSQKLREILTEGCGFQWFKKRCLHKSGRIVYTESSASVIRSRQGDPQYLVGQVLDITERKKAEEALAEMSRKLIAAQEQERARIARELHDDINQRLAILAIGLEQLQDNPAEVRSRVQELRKQTTEISNDVQTLSHELHSSKLEYLGMVAGMKSWCKEFAERQGMQIDFRHDVQVSLPPEIGLSLFRVLQEALNNAVKHSGVKRVEVQLREDSGEIHLTVADLGRGFDVETAMRGKGLGLISMRERVRLVNGTITIDSKPLRGSTIHVTLPLISQSDSARLAG
jgi:PAS domain S-box-containing protein